MTTPAPYDAQMWNAYMDVVTSSVRSLSLIPAAEMLQELGKMEALAPILHPTEYRDGGGENLRDQAELLRAVLDGGGEKLRDQAELLRAVLEVQEAMGRILARKLGATRVG